MVSLDRLSAHCRTEIAQRFLQQQMRMVSQSLSTLHQTLTIPWIQILLTSYQIWQYHLEWHYLTSFGSSGDKRRLILGPTRASTSCHRCTTLCCARRGSVGMTLSALVWVPQRPARQKSRPRNHASIGKNLSQVLRHIRKGQKGRQIFRCEGIASQPVARNLYIAYWRRGERWYRHPYH
ncbi:hypothetical protein JG687_00017389 [Phytophthora cactorum]|uniref:Uncharacterized protein n=1 Tax=Phytophthora cactorum TaxID=29920 RepID=A0A8T1TN69_9STRA|nr:hypothetical protein JG687_00017389 [Phytophthora cactorum]